jgi:diguanylate cyclase (GGDEF)-like protein
MINAHHTGQTLRQFMLRRAGALVAITSVLVAGVFVWFGLVPMAAQNARDQFDSAAARVATGMAAVFEPPVELLRMSRGWLGGSLPDLTSPKAFNQIFKPMLEASPELTSVVAGTSSGQGWLLLQQSNGSWRNRMTDIPRWGANKHLLIDHLPSGDSREHWGEQTYDPRGRPWYKGAVALSDEQAVYWTPPYTFFTTGDPGITLSTRLRLNDGRDFVVGLDLTLRDMSASTLHATVGRHGMALVITDDERVLALPGAPAQVPEAEWLKRVLQPASALGLLPVSDGLAHWHASGRPANAVLRYRSDGEPWLVSLRPYVLGQQQLWMVVLAPAQDFAPAWLPIALALGLALALVVSLAMWITHAGTVALAKPLEVLARTSRRIGELDFQDQQPVVSRVAEVLELAASQRAMQLMLRDSHNELDARAAQLSTQVAALRATESRLQLQNDQLTTIIENFPGGVSVFDADLRLVAFNSQFKSMLELPDALLNGPQACFETVIRFNAQRGDYGTGDVELMVAERVARAKRFEAHRIERLLPSGNTLEVRGMPLPQGGFVTLYMDVTSARRHQRELEHMAHFDALTGLPNRVLLADRLRQGMAQVQRRGQQLAVAYLDLDGFKRVNDTRGHQVGDQMLLQLSNRMKQVLRDGDTLARVGGDEFVVVLLDLNEFDDSLPMIRRLLTAADSTVVLAEHELRVSASVGVTLFPQHQEVDAEQLLRQADQAMYQAKQAGKNRYHVFDAEQDRSLRGQFESLQRLREALVQNEFVLYYQPKVNMRTGTVIGAEALIRWQHPELGLLAPGVFLPLIDDHPLAIDVGQWVIETALAQMSTWRVAGLHLPVSVNVGARQLQCVGFVDNLRLALAAHPGLDPSDLLLEVLETSALEDMARVTEVMQQCRAMGVHYALDDFGTGYSSLTYLKRLPVSQLKIDQSFVRDMLDDPDDLSILVGVLDLSASFHRQVIAEGVETVAHGQMLLRLGCDLAQGYGIARPMPAQELPAWASTWQGDSQWRGVAAVSRHDLPLLFAGAEHRAWVVALEAFLKGEREGTLPLDSHRCHVGQWLDSGGLAQHTGRPAAATITALHQQVHDLAQQLCALKAQGQVQVALQQLPDLLALRDELLDQLRSLLPSCPA